MSAELTDGTARMTQRLLVDAGVGSGMRVLDVGCGRGDVALLVARIVGDEGEVIGIDRDRASIELARRRAREMELTRVRFEEHDLHELGSEYGTFDAVVGRRVLMYLADPVDALRQLARLVRTDGRVSFQEIDSTMPPVSLEPYPLHEQIRNWIWRTVEREGANIHMGLGLAAAFARAGLADIEVRAEAIVETPTTSYPTAAIVRVMLPRIVARGVATAEEIDIETLETRLADERKRLDGVYISGLVFGAWGRKPT